MSWNYRVIRRRHPDEDVLRIHSVFYDEEGQVTMWSVEPVAPAGADVGELTGDLELMRAALGRPFLDGDELDARAADDGPDG